MLLTNMKLKESSKYWRMRKKLRSWKIRLRMHGGTIYMEKAQFTRFPLILQLKLIQEKTEFEVNVLIAWIQLLSKFQ